MYESTVGSHSTWTNSRLCVQLRTGQLTRVRCQAGRSPRLSNAACSRCSAPSFVLRRAREGTGSAQARRRHHGKIAHRSVGDRSASRGMFIVAAVFLTTCQTVLSEMPCPQSLPARQTHRNSGPLSMSAAVNQTSSVSFTQFGTGTVRMCLPLPTKSTMAHRSSRGCKLSKASSASSRRAAHNRAEWPESLDCVFQ